VTPHTRREFLGFGAAALLARVGAAQPAAPGVATAASAPFVYAYVGTYTPNGGGIYGFRIDPESGALSQIQVVGDIRNPSWLALNPERTRLYAVSEIDNYAPATGGGAVASYAIDPRSMRLTPLGIVPSGGNSPAYLSVHPSGRFVFVANYGTGSVAVFPVGADGALGGASDLRPSVGPRHRGHAADDEPGQFAISDHDGPHIHMVAADPSGQFVIANDAGLDLTLVWRFDANAARLLPAQTPVVAAPPGSAPRHFVFHPKGRTFYNLYEHDARIAVYDYDPVHGAMRQRQLISTLPPKFAGSNLASEVIVSADGRFLYSANRLHNAIVSFAIAADGTLRWLGETWVHSDSPRTLCIDPAGAFLYSCNQKGDSITSFRITPATGMLQFTGRFEPVGSPAAMTILQKT
jgi:6-phosphogluconolactonase (cycloisomerase 2 family)